MNELDLVAGCREPQWALVNHNMGKHSPQTTPGIRDRHGRCARRAASRAFIASARPLSPASRFGPCAISASAGRIGLSGASTARLAFRSTAGAVGGSRTVNAGSLGPGETLHAKAASGSAACFGLEDR